MTDIYLTGVSIMRSIQKLSDLGKAKHTCQKLARLCRHLANLALKRHSSGEFE